MGIAKKYDSVIALFHRRKKSSLRLHLLISQLRLVYTRINLIEYIHADIVYRIRENIVLSVTGITQIHHISVATVAVILADAGAEKPPHQQKKYIYVAGSH